MADLSEEVALEPADGLRVVWNPAAVAAYASGADTAAWRLEGSLAPGFTILRVLSAATADGSLVLLAAARPSGADAHGAERVAAVVVDSAGRAQPIAEALVSTEYAADGSIRRLGLELYPPDDDFPTRAAGDAEETSSSQVEGGRAERGRLRFRLDGADGDALYEIVRGD